MKLNFSNNYFPGDPKSLTIFLTRFFREVVEQVNGLSEGRIAAYYQAINAMPTTGSYTQGDFVPNKEPVELGAPGSKYIVTGWTCIASGMPGTWVEARALTGS